MKLPGAVAPGSYDPEVLAEILGHRRRRAPTVAMLMGAVLVGALLFSGMVVVIGLWNRVQESTRRNQCVVNLKMLALALHNYHSDHGSFPPVCTTDSSGRPLHSWRVLLLPYLEREGLYRKIRLDEPWNSPTNRGLHALGPDVFFCPNDPARRAKGLTSYLAVSGPGTVFPRTGRLMRLADLVGWSSNMPMIVESSDGAVHWMEPSEFEIDAVGAALNGSPLPTVSTGDSSGPHVGMADGSVHTVPTMTTAAFRSSYFSFPQPASGP
jgi:hypothetical protein